MQLPVDEEHNEQMVGVPEPLKVRAAALLHREPDHDRERGDHNPAGDTRASEEVRPEEVEDHPAGRLARRRGEPAEVDHVRGGVNQGAGGDGPAGGLVEGDVLVERDDVVQRGAPEHGDEVPADGQEDERGIDVQDERCRTGDGWSWKRSDAVSMTKRMPN